MGLTLGRLPEPNGSSGQHSTFELLKFAGQIVSAVLEDRPRRLGVMVVGLPATRILEVAEILGAQLIVMGSRGLTGIAHLMLGSKAQRVVQLSPIPVTIVKDGHAEASE